MNENRNSTERHPREGGGSENFLTKPPGSRILRKAKLMQSFSKFRDGAEEA